jgi:hypothetical protein
MHPVGSEYAQMDITGEGFKERSPAILFNSDRGNGTDTGTTWELLFTEGVYFKTEGGDNEDENPERVNGIQPDGIRDFGWLQTPTAIGHTHTLTAEKENQIEVKGNTNGTSNNHYHTLEEAINGSTGAVSHSHSGSISMSPSQAVTGAPSTGSTNVGPVIEPTDGHWCEPYGEWSDEIRGNPPNEEGWDYMIVSPNSWGPGYGDGEYGLSGWTDWEAIDKSRGVILGGGGTGAGVIGSLTVLMANEIVQYKWDPIGRENVVFGGQVEWMDISRRTRLGWVEDIDGWRYYGEWVDDENPLCSWSDWIKPPCWGRGEHNMTENGEDQYRSTRYGAWGLGGHNWHCEYRHRNWQNIPNLPKVHGPWSDWTPMHVYPLGDVTYPTQGPTQSDAVADENGIITYWDTQLTKKGENMIIQRRPVKRFFGSNGTYKKRTKTWIPGNNGSGSVDAVSSVNTSFASFSVNTTGISLGGDGSHSHTINISTTATSNDAAHTHSVTASGIADIDVSGKTESGGTHSHTYSFKTNRDLYLLDLLGNLTSVKVPIAGETTVKNRKMRIWRRTA